MDGLKKSRRAYRASKNIYDDTLTQSKWWSRLYIRIFWSGVDDFEIARHVLNMLPDNFEGSLLDVPVGTAVFTEDKYKRMKNASITCIDYSKDMLEQAEERFSKLGVENVICRQGNVECLPFDENSFDAVLSMNGFHAFPNKQKAFRETARVLKKGGIFCGCFYIKGENGITDFIVKQVLARKGWFSPPFYTKAQLQVELEKYYKNIKLYNNAAMVYFRCIK